jgi:predicted NUDIX family NTP pyrophosphohydrolase
VAKKSAGLLLYREKAGITEVLLVHPGGPFWTKKDEGAWSIPKGECVEYEDPLAAARREFEEETGAEPPSGEAIALDAVRQPSGKIVHAWAMRGEFDPSQLKSNTFSMEWPPGSRRQSEFPEVDQAEWFGWEKALSKSQSGQRPILDQLRRALEAGRR